MAGEFTPAFQIANRLLSKIGRKEALSELVNNAPQMDEKQLSKQIKALLESTAAVAGAKDLEVFLQSMAKLMQNTNKDFVERAEKLSSMSHVNQIAERKKLILDKTLIAFLTQSIKGYRVHDRQKNFDAVNSRNLSKSMTEFGESAHQGIYKSTEAEVIRNVLRLFYQFLDLSLVEIGMDPIFYPKEDKSDSTQFLPMPMPAAPPPAPK